jgi:hypothetical protein
MKHMNTRIVIYASICVLVLFAFSFSPLNPKPAAAHIAKSFGNYIVELGWNNEPALTGQMNAAQITVVKGSHVDTGQPVIDALANMTFVVQYGTITKPLSFLPSPTVNGQYLATILPTQVGTYTVIMNGTVEDQQVNTEIPLDEVVNVDTVSFPQTGSSGVSNNAIISSQLGTIVNQLTNDITDAKNSINSAAQNYQDAAKSIQDQKDAVDRLYMISMVGIGLGAAGIVIAVVALTRKA